jgi:hypothetical protein
MGKRGPNPGSTWKRKGDYHLSSMAVGEHKVIPLEGSGKRDVAHLAINIAHCGQAVRNGTFTTMRLADGVYVRRLT